MNRGLIVPKIEHEHYVFGDQKLGDSPINPSGDWTQFLPVPEDQAPFNFEPMACTIFALLNAVKTMIRQEFGNTQDFSKKFLAYISGTTQNGNDPHTVAEALRTKGDVSETDWPYTQLDTSWDTFYAVPPQTLYPRALLWTADYDFGHSWVSPATPAALMTALTYSPLTAGVYAWQQDASTGFYVNPSNLAAEHDIMIYGYEKGKYWKILDTYSNEFKKLAWDFPFVAVKRYTLHKKTTAQALPVWQLILSWATLLLEKMKQQLALGEYSHERTLGASRSPQWSTFKRQFEKTHPKQCAVCGNPNVQLHHATPFHINQGRELDATNVLWLCEGKGTLEHHRGFGHLGDFKSWNGDIFADAPAWHDKITTRPYEGTTISKGT